MSSDDAWVQQRYAMKTVAWCVFWFLAFAPLGVVLAVLLDQPAYVTAAVLCWGLTGALVSLVCRISR